MFQVNTARPTRLALGKRLLISLCLLLSTLGGVVAHAQDANDSLTRSLNFTNDVEALEERIANIEGSHGPFDRQLLEPLEALVRIYIENGNYNSAVPLLEQQLQILRISDGLYSVAQIPLIELQLDIAARNEDWRKSSDALEYLAWLYQRDTTLTPHEKLTGMGTLSAWHLRALGKDAQEREAFHLVKMAQIDERISDIAEQLYGEDSIEIAPYLYNQALTDAYMALAITLTYATSQELILLTEGISNRPGLQGGLYSTNLRTAADLEARYGSKASTVIDRSFKNNMRDSSEKLQRLRDLYAEAGDIEAEAMALMYLGDSTLIRQQFEKRAGSFAGIRRGTSSAGTATSFYRDALALFAEAGVEQALIDTFTSCPVLLPLGEFYTSIEAASKHCQQLDNAENIIDLGEYNLLSTIIPGIHSTSSVGEKHITATVRFDVLANGQVRRRNIISIEPDDTASRVKVRKLLEISQFRPALVDGSAVRSENVQFLVRIPNDD